MSIEYIRDPDASSGTPPLGARAGDFVFFSGGIAADPMHGVPAQIQPVPTYPHHGSSIDRQLRYVFSKMGDVLVQGGSDLKQIMKISTSEILSNSEKSSGATTLFFNRPEEGDTAFLGADYRRSVLPPANNTLSLSVAGVESSC